MCDVVYSRARECAREEARATPPEDDREDLLYALFDVRGPSGSLIPALNLSDGDFSLNSSARFVADANRVSGLLPFPPVLPAAPLPVLLPVLLVLVTGRPPVAAALRVLDGVLLVLEISSNAASCMGRLKSA